jgi:hypothetical protein
MSGKDPVGELGAGMFFAIVGLSALAAIGAVVSGEPAVGIVLFLGLGFLFWVLLYNP